MREVARNRNAFAHRMLSRSVIPTHYAQGLNDDRLTDKELNDQNRQAFIASELCRQLAGWFLDPPLNPGYQYRRVEPAWLSINCVLSPRLARRQHPLMPMPPSG
jgi:hypothetical protein